MALPTPPKPKRSLPNDDKMKLSFRHIAEEIYGAQKSHKQPPAKTESNVGQLKVNEELTSKLNEVNLRNQGNGQQSKVMSNSKEQQTQKTQSNTNTYSTEITSRQYSKPNNTSSQNLLAPPPPSSSSSPSPRSSSPSPSPRRGGHPLNTSLNSSSFPSAPSSSSSTNLNTSQSSSLAPPLRASGTRAPSPRRNTPPTALSSSSSSSSTPSDAPSRVLPRPPSVALPADSTPKNRPNPLRESGNAGKPPPKPVVNYPELVNMPLNISQTFLATQVPLPPSPSPNVQKPPAFLHSSSTTSLSSSSPLPPSSPSPSTFPPALPTYQSAPSFSPFLSPPSPSPSSPLSPPLSSSPSPLSPKLFRALWTQNAEALANALAKGAQVNELSPDGLTPLHVAAHLGFMEGAVALVEHGADVNMRTIEGETPIFAAAQNDHAEVVKYLLSKGADYNAVVGPMRLTPLMQACAGGYAGVVKHLVRCPYISINAQEMQYGMTALCFAAAGGHAQAVIELLAFGADPNAKTWEHSTALLIASANGYGDIVRELCLKQADAKMQDKGGETALHRAVLAGHVESVLALVYVPANPGEYINIRNNHNATPLFIACALGHLELVRVLIQQGADTNLMAKHETPLSVALARANISVVLELLQCGVKHDLDQQLVETIIAGTCTNMLSNNGLRQQFWFQCVDCFGEADSRICLSCALVYHKEHLLRYHSFTYYMCRGHSTPTSAILPQPYYNVISQNEKVT